MKSEVTERTTYPELINIINSFGGHGVSEIKYESQPDVLLKYKDKEWIISVKVGEDARTIKDMFIQYLRHKEESGIKYAILLFFPNSIRKVLPDQEKLRRYIETTKVTVLIDTPLFKTELRDRTFRAVMEYITEELGKKIESKAESYYSLSFVINLLKEQVEELMSEVDFNESTVLKVITDKKLLMDLGHLRPQQSEAVGRFLASYILMSQVLFMRLLYTQRPEIFGGPIGEASHHTLRRAFSKILEVNYRPIFSIDVLDPIPEKFIKDTFDLIWGLQIENVRYEIPGRIFHKLMPLEIRKILAAFYTRPQAAEILANLSINNSDSKIFDPACGSGTILVAGYRRKLELYKSEGKVGNPHKRFCEEDIVGADIMPFAVHLASANLSAMDAGTPIERTQIILGDSLKLIPGRVFKAGIRQLGLSFFQETPLAETTAGDKYEVELNKVEAVLMNPPFTKVERGIAKFVDMAKYDQRCGGEVGLWGHFIALASDFLQTGGSVGAVIPINILRGRESADVRTILFKEWTPLYILKPTFNYGFSEWSEYRDIIIVAEKKPPTGDDKVKFCLIKKDLVDLTDKDHHSICDLIRNKDNYRSKDLDINSASLSDIYNRFDNLMWFCSGTDLTGHDHLISFVEKFHGKLSKLPDRYFKEGFRPVPEGVSKFLFLTRKTSDARTEQAFLRFSAETATSINAVTPLDVNFELNKESFVPSLRTPVGVNAMDITNKWDYLATAPYNEFDRVLKAVDFDTNQDFGWNDFWKQLQNEVKGKETNLVVSRRINPSSPSTHLLSFNSLEKFVPSNQVNIITEKDSETANALCAILNSAIFLAQFFLLKEESTGRFIDIRFYDLMQMILFPKKSDIPALSKVYEKYRLKTFPSLREQLDTNFNLRYVEFVERERDKSIQERLFSVFNDPVKPDDTRLNFDLDVCKALNIDVSEKDLISVYEVMVKEMMITRSLGRD